ncbi:hypothetical protein THTE_1120 [Thermogutta terrifontis]|uniref:Uncharacterized protein n=1 Tax=Thermogutta terrifontis TaxID=1331910 RepID=A0A286RCN2_9BACT|nr:hypothetical protein THTE_1120 [Thermogutta terrifontis]
MVNVCRVQRTSILYSQYDTAAFLGCNSLFLAGYASASFLLMH